MIRRSTLVLVILFVIAAAFALYWQRSGNGQEAASPSPTPQAQVLSLVSDSIQTIRVQDSSSAAAQYDEQADGSWVLMGEPQQTAKPEQVVQVINQLSTLKALNSLANPPSDEALGLKPPAYRIVMTDDQGGTHQLEIGAITATGSGYYIRAGGKVFVVSKSTIDTAVQLLTTPPILTPAPTVTVTVASTPTP